MRTSVQSFTPEGPYPLSMAQADSQPGARVVGAGSGPGSNRQTLPRKGGRERERVSPSSLGYTEHKAVRGLEAIRGPPVAVFDAKDDKVGFECPCPWGDRERSQA